MKKAFRRLLLFTLLTGILFTNIPSASAYQLGDPWRPDLRPFLQDSVKRDYVQTMVDHHIRTDRDIRSALEGGIFDLE